MKTSSCSHLSLFLPLLLFLPLPFLYTCLYSNSSHHHHSLFISCTLNLSPLFFLTRFLSLSLLSIFFVTSTPGSFSSFIYCFFIERERRKCLIIIENRKLFLSLFLLLMMYKISDEMFASSSLSQELLQGVLVK